MERHSRTEIPPHGKNPPGETCGGQGKANQCSCLSKTCGQLNAACGKAQDGCGAEIECGGCPSGQTCGTQVPNQCAGAAEAGGEAGAGGTAGAGGAKGGAAGTAGSGGGDAGACTVPPPANCPSASGGPTLVPVCGGYCIDATEVTRDQYAAWLATNPPTTGQPPECFFNLAADAFVPTCEWPPGTKGNYPVVCVDWCDAYAFCKGVGKRLCGKIGGGSYVYNTSVGDATVSQWYNVCSSGGVYTYPYGNTYEGKTCKGMDVGPSGVIPVGALPDCTPKQPGYQGVYDLSGNVWEWEDACAPYAWDPVDGGHYDVCQMRGGCFGNPDYALLCDDPGGTMRDNRMNVIGLRCCSDP